ncbi:MAG: hypothetical protein GWP19_06860 [Planctomycetia bacterium]|nr:hypothetical protein [Planctomycetia bacterium]
MKNFYSKLIFLILIIPISIYSQYAISGDVYFKGTVGYGFVQEKLYTGVRIREEGVITKEIYISPGGGKNIEWSMGVHISSSLKTEVDVAYQYSGDRFNNGTVLFRRFPVGLSLVKEYQRNDSYLLYGRIGILGVLTPKYYDELDGSKYSIDYHNSYGGQIGVGLMHRIESKRAYFILFHRR